MTQFCIKLSDSEQARVEGVRARLERRILYPRTFNVNNASDMRFLLELIDPFPFPAGNAEGLPDAAAKMDE